MRSRIQQSVVLPASAKRLYETYLDPKLHAAITGGPVKVGSAPGAEFSAWDGSITGTTLAVVAPRLIVQSWRSSNFRKKDPDSTLILTFVPAGRKGRIDLIHLDVPEQDYQGVSEGWDAYYWEPWRRWLAKKRR